MTFASLQNHCFSSFSLFFCTVRDRKQMSTCINSLCLPSQLQLYTTKGKERISSLKCTSSNSQYSILHQVFQERKTPFPFSAVFPLYFLHLLSPRTSSSSHLNKAGRVAEQQLSSTSQTSAKNVCPSVTKVCQKRSSVIPSSSQPCSAELVLL